MPNHRLLLDHTRYVVEERGYETPCHIWQNKPNSAGYGTARDPETGRVRSVHVLYYEQEYGPVTPGFLVHHLCFVRLCVRTEHLKEVTRAEHTRLHRQKSPKLIHAVRLRHASTALNHAEIALEFGLSRSVVTNIIAGKTYADF